MLQVRDEDNKTHKETSLLIQDRSTKIGTIYFIGLSSKFCAGKIVLKKNIVSDKVVRQTNLSDNLFLIESGNFNIKQTAILIKGVTVLLHRQLEVLIYDLRLLNRKFVLNIAGDFKHNSKRTRKDKNQNAIKKKLLTLRDIKTSSNDAFSESHTYLNKNKNVLNTKDLMLKESFNEYNDHYNFEHLNMFKGYTGPNICPNIFDNMSSLEYTKVDNLFTLGNESSNLFSKNLIGDLKNINSNEKNIHLNMFDSSLNDISNLFNSFKKDDKIEKFDFTSDIFDKIFTGKQKYDKPIDYSWTKSTNFNDLFKNVDVINENLNFSFSQHMNQRANITANNIEKDKKMEKGNNKKKNIAEIDQEITLKENVWDESKLQKKQKRKFKNCWDELFSGERTLIHLVNNDNSNSNGISNINKKKEGEFSSFYNFYEIIKNYDHLDTRKNLFNRMEKLIETENKINTDVSCHNEMKKKLYEKALNTDSSLKTANDFYFEQLRENFTQQNFASRPEEQTYKKQKIDNDYSFNSSSFSQQEKYMPYDFDNSLNDNQYQTRDQIKTNEVDREGKNFNSYSDVNNSIFKDSSKSNNLTDSLKDSLSVPSSKLMNKRSSTSISSPIYKYDNDILRLKTYIDKYCNTETEPLDFEIICPVHKVNYKNASMTFYNLLVLASNDDIELCQSSPEQKIFIRSC